MFAHELKQLITSTHVIKRELELIRVNNSWRRAFAVAMAARAITSLPTASINKTTHRLLESLRDADRNDEELHELVSKATARDKQNSECFTLLATVLEASSTFISSFSSSCFSISSLALMRSRTSWAKRLSRSLFWLS
eukprot:gene46891-58486_t